MEMEIKSCYRTFDGIARAIRCAKLYPDDPYWNKSFSDWVRILDYDLLFLGHAGVSEKQVIASIPYKEMERGEWDENNEVDDHAELMFRMFSGPKEGWERTLDMVKGRYVK